MRQHNAGGHTKREDERFYTNYIREKRPLQP
nr:MAG TPA: hypothetical protein [Caudoviricetes sp.]